MDSAKPAVVKEQNHLGEKLFAIPKICQKINSERDLTALLDLIAVEATKLVEADRATIFLLDREKHEQRRPSPKLSARAIPKEEHFQVESPRLDQKNQAIGHP